MKAWSVEFAKTALKDLDSLDNKVRSRILDKIEWTSNNFDNAVHLPLTGQYRDFYKLRVGDWRVVYSIEWQSKKIIIQYIDHRNKVYKRN